MALVSRKLVLISSRALCPWTIVQNNPPVFFTAAPVTLAETLGSIASYLIVDPSKKTCVGLDINANHIRSVHKGLVTGVARPIHIGSLTHVWQIEIKDEDSRLICISRLTICVLETKR